MSEPEHPRVAAARMADDASRRYSSADERSAIRCALGDAAGLCDLLSRRIEFAHTSRGYVTKLGRSLAAEAKRCGDEIWAMRDRIDVPRG